MPPRAAKTSPVMIVLLVCFVLTSLILAVTTYLGFSGQAEYVAAAKKAADGEKTWHSSSDWYEFLALTYKAYCGQDLTAKEKEDIGSLRRSFGESGGTLLTAANSPDKDVNAKLVKETLDAKRGWDAGANKAVRSYEADLEAFKKERDQLADSLAKSQAGEQEAQAKISSLEKQLVDEKRNYAEGLQKARQEFDKDLAGYVQKIAQLNKDKEEMGKTIEDLRSSTADLKTESEKKISKLNKDREALAQNEKKLRTKYESQVSILDYDHPKGKILKIDPSQRTVYINLGSADNLKPGITFSVYSTGPDGKPIAHDVLGPDGKPVIGTDLKPEKEGKATIEVISINDSHLASARVTWVRDPGRDPILSGDLLFNPGWDPNTRQHVAVTGLIDLTGDGRDDSAEFLRILERQGVLVDAFLDLKTVQVKGHGIDRQTDFLVLGTRPDFQGSEAVKEDDPRARRVAQISKAMDEMQQKALDNGVTIISLRKFLVLSGVHVGPGVGVETGSSSSRPPIFGGTAPAGKEK